MTGVQPLVCIRVLTGSAARFRNSISWRMCWGGKVWWPGTSCGVGEWEGAVLLELPDQCTLASVMSCSRYRRAQKSPAKAQLKNKKQVVFQLPCPPSLLVFFPNLTCLSVAQMISNALSAEVKSLSGRSAPEKPVWSHLMCPVPLKSRMPWPPCVTEISWHMTENKEQKP